MKRCLDEAMLQSYFDGELSSELMESATLHLASCVSCAVAARELEQESALLSEAFGLEFEESIPSERLRRRVDAAIAGLQVVRPVVQQSGAVSGFFASLSNLFSFSPQRTFGYAALIVMLAFGVIFGLMKLRSTTPSNTGGQGQLATNTQKTTPSPVVPKVTEPTNGSGPVQEPAKGFTAAPARVRAGYKSSAPKSAVVPKPAPVQLLPGERTYLQTIAKLDSSIKEGKNMRPALQAEYERNLAVVDGAIAATRTAVKKNPNDPDAADFMFAAYQSKVDLLNTIADARVYNRTH